MNSDNKFMLEKNLYNEDSPLLILGGGISKTGDGNQYARIQFMNIGKNGISEVKVRLKLYENDLTMHISDVEYTYTSLNCARGKTFGDDDLISIKDSDVDSFKIEVISIEYVDNSISKDVISNWEAMEFYNKLESTYSSEKAIEQYKKEFGNNAKFVYKKQGELWQCACGCVNYVDEPICYNCSVTKRGLEEVGEASLIEKAEENDRKQKMAETSKQKDAKKKKVKKIVLIASAVALVIVAIVAGLIINSKVIAPKNKYEDAKQYLAYNKFEEAYNLFVELGDYKDAQEQQVICKYNEITYYLDNGMLEEAGTLLNTFKTDERFAQYVDECSTKYTYVKGKASYEDGDYKAAITTLNAIKDYEDAEDIINDAKYQYVVDNKQELTDLVESYVEDLHEISYPGIQAIYDELYTLKVSFIVNNSETDAKTNMSAVSTYDTRYYHFVITGFEKNESIGLSYIIYFADGSNSAGDFEYDASRSNEAGYVYAYSGTPAYLFTGTERVELYNRDTGELIGSKSVQVTN